MNLGFVHLHRHDPDWAFRLFKESVSIYRAAADVQGLAWNISGFAAVAAERHESAKAARLYGALEVAVRNLQIVLDPDDQLDFDRYSKMTQDQMGADAFRAAVAEGRRLSVEEALTLAQRQP